MMKFKRLPLMIGLIMLLLVAAQTTPVHASQYLGTVQITCTNFTAAGTGASILDRDNTGAGQEALRIDVVDGAGTLLYTLSFQNALGTYAAGLINTTAYTTAPRFNPITFTLTSLAGNGLPQQVDVNVQGTCPGLPTANAQFFTCTDGRLNCEPGAPAALYCRDGGVDIYRVDPATSRGILAGQVTKAQIDAVKNSNPAANTLIKSFSGLDLYWLPGSGELAFVTHYGREGKQYNYIWKGC
jgi:hypothetical protein